MNRVEAMKSKIENLVEIEEVKRGDIIRMPNLPEDLMILLSGCYAGNRDYEMSHKTNLDVNNPDKVTYNLYLKYVGKKNA